jgi:hypothetical protein
MCNKEHINHKLRSGVSKTHFDLLLFAAVHTEKEKRKNKNVVWSKFYVDMPHVKIDASFTAFYLSEIGLDLLYSIYNQQRFT